MKNLFSKLIPILTVSAFLSFVLFSCSDINSNESGSVSFSVSPELAKAVLGAGRAATDDSDTNTSSGETDSSYSGRYDSYRIEVSMTDDRNESQTKTFSAKEWDSIAKGNTSEAKFTFNDIRVGSIVTVSAKLFSFWSDGNSSDSNGIYRMTGSSAPAKIEAGDNPIAVNMHRLAPFSITMNYEKSGSSGTLSNIKKLNVYALPKGNKTAASILEKASKTNSGDSEEKDEAYNQIVSLLEHYPPLASYSNLSSSIVNDSYELPNKGKYYIFSLLYDNEGTVYFGHFSGSPDSEAALQNIYTDVSFDPSITDSSSDYERYAWRNWVTISLDKIEYTYIFPEKYAGKTVAAWYLGKFIDEDADSSGTPCTKTEYSALFLFTDGTFVVTAHKIKTTNGQILENAFNYVMRGNYSYDETDFTSGKLTLIPTAMFDNGEDNKNEKGWYPAPEGMGVAYDLADGTFNNAAFLEDENETPTEFTKQSGEPRLYVGAIYDDARAGSEPVPEPEPTPEPKPEPGEEPGTEPDTETEENYSITYYLNGGSWITAYTPPHSYTPKTEVVLPTAEKLSLEGYGFCGWFTSPDGGTTLDGNAITIIPVGGKGHATFYAKWKLNTFYVGGTTGSDTDGDGTKEKPYASISKAVELLNDSALDYKILVIGSITGSQQIIPDTLTTDMAKSLLITGATGVDADGVPQDALDRGVNATTNGTTNGNVLVVSTAVPVTITNLKITRGAAADGSAIKICEGSTVKLWDGVLITKNHYQSNSRGTVHNEGTLFMYGSAVIGDKTVQEFAYGSSSPSNISDGTNANYVTSGGGIFNGVYSSTTTVVAHLYLGYSGFEEDGVTLIKKELTGGIYKNGASSGGAIYNSYNSYAYIDSGNFEWNSVSGCGGAIYNEEGAYLEMTGGSILNNRAYEGGNYTGYGGGIYNNGANSVFVMAGGTINKNLTQNDSGYGGGLYNKGKFFMYGTAVIGDETAESPASATAWGNKSQKGGGIYNTDTGFVYLGYKPDSSRNPVLEELTGGIYGNYATGTSDGVGGGAINNYGGNSGGIFKIASGTIAYNASGKNGGAIWHRQANYSTPEILGGTIENNFAEENGGAIYIDSSNKNTLTFYESAFILRDADGKHDIYLDTGSKTYYPKITIGGKLREDFDVRVTPGFYDPSMTILLLADDADTTLEEEHLKFSVTDETNENLGTRTEWYINSSGTLTSQTPLGTLTMTIEHSTYSDISVSARYYDSGTTTYSSSTGTKWYESNGLVTGKILVFTVTPPTGVELNSYTWYVDGETNKPSATAGATSEPYSTTDMLVLDTAGWTVGVYDLALEATDSNGTNYSYEAHISVKAQ